MKARDGIAVTALVLLALSGGWLVAAPFLLHVQPAGAAWTRATRTDLWFGLGLLALSLLALTGYAAAALREVAVRYARPGRHQRHS
ncbi:hypothetical protein [Actinocatenispora rupis]|uniref:Uncharacterized protein n=1 Tax=Actinocatenispora rupis TaxID=519421 RepID=A0A8J3J502_9ACTN|nr:hypothetical protein [Actinocatenispora rupis]GID14258.1 hypothetical protein Aru02nite_51470 [Actinocatenispora rupis]